MKIHPLLEKSGGLKKYFFNTLYLFADQAQRLVLAFFVGIFVARYLGPADYGKISYAQGFIGLFAAFTHMGLTSILVRDIVNKRFTDKELLGTAWFIQFIGSNIGLFAAIMIIGVTNSSKEILFLVALIGSNEVVKSLGVIRLFFEAKIQTKGLVKISFIQGMLTASFKIFLILVKAKVIWFGLAIFVDGLIGAICLVFLFQIKVASIFSWRIKKRVARTLMKDAWPMIFYGMALQIQAKIDQVMLGNMVGQEEVGYYSVAHKIIEIFVMLPFILSKSLAPSVTEAKSRNEKIYQDRLLNLYRLFFLVFLIYGGVVFVVSESLIVLFYGEAYRESGVLLSLFAIRLFFNCMGIARSNFITNENLFKHGMISAIVGAIVNICANYYLIPLYQSRGAIIATIISFTCFIFIVDLINRNTRRNLKLMLKGIGTFFLVKKV